MKLHGFTKPCLRLGQIEVNPSPDNPIPCCSQCKTFLSKIMILCECKHLMCELCAVEDDNKILCKICKGMQNEVRRLTFNEEIVQAYTTICSCGEEIELKDLKQHVIDAGNCFNNEYQGSVSSEETKNSQEIREIKDELKEMRMLMSEFIKSAEENRLNNVLEKQTASGDMQKHMASVKDEIKKVVDVNTKLMTQHEENIQKFATDVEESLKTICRHVQEVTKAQEKINQELLNISKVASMSNALLNTELGENPTVGESEIGTASESANQKYLLGGPTKPGPSSSLGSASTGTTYSTSSSETIVRFVGFRTSYSGSELSETFECGGILWRLKLHVILEPGQIVAHQLLCNASNIHECPHKHVGVYWYPQKPPNGKKSYFPIAKTLDVGPLVNGSFVSGQTVTTFVNGKYLTPAFESYNGGGYGFHNFLTYRQFLSLLGSGNDIVLAVRIRDP